jgi:hypothetical protein
MKEYINLKAILDNSRIPSQLQIDCGKENILSWGLDAYRMLKIPDQLKFKFQLFEIKDHQVQLPNDVKLINHVSYSSIKPTNTDCNDIELYIYDNTNDVNPTSNQTHIVGDYAIAHKLFLDSTFYNNNIVTLFYNGVKNNLDICKTCKVCFTCDNTYSIDINKVLWSPFKSGYLCIEYFTELKDDNEDFMIINTPEILRYISLYAQTQCFLTKASSKEEGAYQIYNNLLNQTEIAFKKAKGSELLKSINVDNYDRIISNTKALLNLTKQRAYERRI